MPTGQPSRNPTAEGDQHHDLFRWDSTNEVPSGWRAILNHFAMDTQLSATALGEFILQTAAFSDGREVQENNNEYLSFIHILNILYISFKLSRTSLSLSLTLRIWLSYCTKRAGPMYTRCFRKSLKSIFLIIFWSKIECYYFQIISTYIFYLVFLIGLGHSEKMG